MEERFEILSRMVWGVHGDVQKLKMQIAAELGIKGAHVFLIYLLRNYPDGLTAAQLCDMNRSTGGKQLSCCGRGSLRQTRKATAAVTGVSMC